MLLRDYLNLNRSADTRDYVYAILWIVLAVTTVLFHFSTFQIFATMIPVGIFVMPAKIRIYTPLVASWGR